MDQTYVGKGQRDPMVFSPPKVLTSRLAKPGGVPTSEGVSLSVLTSRRPEGGGVLKCRATGGSETVPDVTLLISDLADAEESEKLKRALMRLEFVELVNVDPEKGLVAVSYEGGEEELRRIEGAIEEAGHTAEPSPGAEHGLD